MGAVRKETSKYIGTLQTYRDIFRGFFAKAVKIGLSVILKQSCIIAFRPSIPIKSYIKIVCQSLL